MKQYNRNLDIMPSKWNSCSGNSLWEIFISCRLNLGMKFSKAFALHFNMIKNFTCLHESTFYSLSGISSGLPGLVSDVLIIPVCIMSNYISDMNAEVNPIFKWRTNELET